MDVARTGLSRMSRTNSVSTRSYSSASTGPASVPASGRGSGVVVRGDVTDRGSSWAADVAAGVWVPAASDGRGDRRALARAGVGCLGQRGRGPLVGRFDVVARHPVMRPGADLAVRDLDHPDAARAKGG